MSQRHRAGVLVAIVSIVALAAPAHAQNPTPNTWDPFACSKGNHAVVAEVGYYLTSTQHQWGTVRAVAQGTGLGNKNNFFDAVYSNGIKVYNWQSSDSYSKDERWTDTGPGGENLRTARSATEVVQVKGVFDVFGPDPSCTAKRTY